MIRGFYPGEKSLSVLLNLTVKDFKQGETVYPRNDADGGWDRISNSLFLSLPSSERNLRGEDLFETDTNGAAFY